MLECTGRVIKTLFSVEAATAWSFVSAPVIETWRAAGIGDWPRRRILNRRDNGSILG
jgi:hypothetical protein